MGFEFQQTTLVVQYSAVELRADEFLHVRLLLARLLT